MYHHFIPRKQIEASYVWESSSHSFNELLISWNGKRPEKGFYAIYVSVRVGGIWSPWHLYAHWGSDFQKGFISTQKNSPISVFQDAVQVREGKKGDGFRVRVLGEKGAHLSRLFSLHVNANVIDEIERATCDNFSTSYLLDVPKLSQMALADERRERLCSPTSTTAVVSFLMQMSPLDPVSFAERVWDAEFDIFGNWVLNVAEASSELCRKSYSCWIERVQKFQTVLDSLAKGCPVIASVRGPLVGSAQAYKEGHLLVIIGFDQRTQEVICMDPAFLTPEKTQVRYPLIDFLQAWHRRKNVAYRFAIIDWQEENIH